MQKRSVVVMRRSGVAALLLGLTFYLMQEPDYAPTAIVGTGAAVLPRIILSIDVPEPVNKRNYITREVDVSMSVDGVLFVIRGGVSEPWCGKTWEEIKMMMPASERLEDFLKGRGPTNVPFLRVRRVCGNPAYFAKRLSGFLRSNGLQSTVIVGSKNPLFLIFMRLEARDIVLNYLQYSPEENEEGLISFLWSMPFFQKQVRRFVRPDILSVDDFDTATNFLSLGYPVVLCGVRNEKHIEAIQKYACGLVHIDEPRILQYAALSASLYDAGGTLCNVNKIVRVQCEGDVLKALREARAQKLQVCVGGVRHSMDGQAVGEGMVCLDMMPFNGVSYNPETRRVTAKAGATWRMVQDCLDDHQRSVHVMQSDNVFSLGGSVSVNVHGWQVGSPPVVDDIHSLRLMLADGRVKTLSRTENADLFAAVVGGYGQIGVITQVELNTVPNTLMAFDYYETNLNDFLEVYEAKVADNPNVQLAYARVNTDSRDTFEKIGLFWYEDIPGSAIRPMQQERMVALKRAIVREAVFGDVGKKFRWIAESAFAKAMRGTTTTRNTAMCSDVHVIPHLQGLQNTLQEYFVPKARLVPFLRMLRKTMVDHGINIVNITIREVRPDTVTLLSYAKQPMFSLVLWIVHNKEKSNQVLEEFTRDLIDHTLNFEGNFYLPYRTYGTCKQFLAGYPRLPEWRALKKTYDPHGVFSSQFMQNLEKCFVQTHAG